MEKRSRPSSFEAPRSRPTSSEMRPAARVAAPLAASWASLLRVEVMAATVASSAPARRFRICSAESGGSEVRVGVTRSRVPFRRRVTR